jgi:hypothetical protein
MDATKIHVGAGNLVLNPGIDDIDLGYCSDGGLMNYSAPIEPITVDQVLGPVGFYVPGEESSFETVINELAMSKLRYALGHGTLTTAAAGVDSKGYDKLEFGGQFVLTEFSMEYRAPKRTNRNLFVRICLYKVYISPEVELTFTKDGKTGYKITLKAAADTTKPAGKQLGYFMEETAEPTGDVPVLAVSTVVPDDGLNDIAVDAEIVWTFNRDVNPDSVNAGNFILIKDDGTKVAGSVSRTGIKEVKLIPTENLDNASTYIAVVAKDVRALDDNSQMADNHVTDFTTVVGG